MHTTVNAFSEKHMMKSVEVTAFLDEVAFVMCSLCTYCALDLVVFTTQ